MEVLFLQRAEALNMGIGCISEAIFVACGECNITELLW